MDELDEIKDIASTEKQYIKQENGRIKREMDKSKKSEDEEYSSNNCQWVINDNNFYTIGRTVQRLPSGYYTYFYSSNAGKIIFTKVKVITDDILKLPDPTLENILLDFQKFWAKKELYHKYEFIYKRAYLMYGPAGCGKTSLISLLAKELITKEGIILNINTHDQIDYYDKAIKDIREIEKDKPIIVIIEDIDGYTDTSYVSRLLNILDGAYQTDNVIVIATTNYPERLEERFSSRPSRFDVRVLIDVPSPEVRKFYIESKLKSSELKNISIDDWIKVTEGFTLDHLKELILLTFVLENDFDESLAKVKEMLRNTKIKAVGIRGNNGGGSGIGFAKAQLK